MDEKKEKQGMQKEKQQRKQQHDDSRSATEEVMKLAAMAIKLNLRLRSSDMPPHMQEHVFRFTRSFLDSSPKTTPPNPSHLARALKKVRTAHTALFFLFLSPSLTRCLYELSCLFLSSFHLDGGLGV